MLFVIKAVLLSDYLKLGTRSSCARRVRILGRDGWGRKDATSGDIFQEAIIYREEGEADRVLKHVALKNKPDISETGISMAVLESIRPAVKIKVEGTSAPRQTLEVEKNQEH